MQLQDIRSRVRERLGLSSSDPALTDAVLTELINAAVRQINLQHDWPWLEKYSSGNFVVGNDYIAWPSDFRRMIWMRVDGDTPMRPKQSRDLQRFKTFNGRPGYYAIEPSTVSVAPVPDSTYSYRMLYLQTETALSGDTDEPLIFDWAIDLLVITAALIAAGRMKDREQQRVLEPEYIRMIQSIRDDVRTTREYPTPQHRLDIGWT